jgi:hypothetical protein
METICVCRGHEGLYQQARLNLKVGYFLGKYKLGQEGGGWGGGAHSSVYTVYTGPLHIITSAYIIVFIHYTNSSAYSATGYIIVCIQGKASH